MSEIKDIWERAKIILLTMLKDQDLKNKAERYFPMIKKIISENGKAVFYTNYERVSETLEKEFGEYMKKCLQLASGQDWSIEFRIEEGEKPKIIIPVNGHKVQTPERCETSASKFISTMPLKDDYTFEEFVEGPSNSWALAAAKGAAKDPGKKGYNPLFIHGGTGLGKTHIMQAIGNEVKKNRPDAAICYLTAEVFLNEYVNALSKQDVESFRERYRKIDVLLIDDIQFLAANMQKFQEEFFNTFNALYSADKQIVVTSDVAPKELHGLEARLISRFEGGMLQEIESPNYETSLAILKKKSEGLSPSVPENALKFIAQNIKSHVRAIEAALGKVHFYAALKPGMLFSEEELSYILKDLIEKEKPRQLLSIEEVQNAVAKKYSITLMNIVSAERTASMVTPRQLAMYISRKYTTKSLPEIASKFEKSHATIIHGVKTITKRLDVEPELKASLEDILSELGCSIKDMVNS